MTLNSNSVAQSAANELSRTSAALSKSLSKLSSGSRIVNSFDDAAGLAITSRFDAKLARANAAKDNVLNALSFSSTQDGYLKRVAKTLNRMSELAMLSLDGSKTDRDRSFYTNEFNQLKGYITNMATKEFNGVTLFSSATISSFIDSEGTTFDMSGVDLSAATYLNVTGSSIASTSSATTALSQVRLAIDQLAFDRALVGANQARLNMASDYLAATIETFSAATSAIKDVNVATESTEFSRQNILNQATTAMFAQANQLPQSVLKLLPN